MFDFIPRPHLPSHQDKQAHAFPPKIIHALILNAFTCSQVYAAAIPDVPLQAMTSVDPNVLMIIDDSGSMQFEVMPDSDNVYFVYPRPDPLYNKSWGYGTNFDTVATFDSANRYARYFRTAQFNPLYYDPKKRYLPWSNQDGSLMNNASPSAACHNPYRCPTLYAASASNEGNINLTQNQTQSTYWAQDNGSEGWQTITFYPATFFLYNGTATLSSPTDANNLAGSFTRYEIRSGNTYTWPNASERTDCTLNNGTATCNYTQEIQNFANWYTYYRSRILTARAGIGRAFASQGSNLRVGYGSINTSNAIITGVRPFSGSDRSKFFTSLYDHTMPSAGTPLRQALDNAGKYYSDSASDGPWSSTPGTSGGTIAECRQSYTILMTDGYWNTGLAPASTTNAQADNDSISGPTITGPNGKTYTYAPRSPFSDTRSNTLADVAMYYWKRDLLPDYANRVPTNSKDPAFWQHMVTFGVGLGVTGSINPTTAFAAIENTSAPSISWPNPEDANKAIAEPAKLDDLLHAAVNSRGDFFTAQNPTQFADSLKSVLNAITKRTSSAASVAANSTRLTTASKVYSATFNTDNWSGELSAYSISESGLAASPTWKSSEQVPAASLRKIYSYQSNSGKEFTTTNFASSLTANVVDYIRGDRSKEKQNGGTLRDRISLLGDIVNSSPVYDLYTETVYVGSNDGMLHAFNANTGTERFAYIPSPALSKLTELTQSNYSHKFFADGDLALTSSRLNFLDKTYLVGTLGRGGKGLFGLDVTSPSTFDISSVKWEYTSSTDGDLGYMLGQPMIANLNNGKVGVIVGNGYNSTSGRAVLYIIDVETGSLIKKIDTNVGSDNGLSTPGLWDEDGDGYIDYIYAGDMKGNLWKFDISNDNPNSWGSPRSIFSAKDASNNAQPITAPVTLARNYVKTDPNYQKVFALFGTGAFFRSEDLSDTKTQSWYGIITTPSSNNESITRAALKQRTIASETTVDSKAARVFSSAVTTPTHDMSGKAGWYIDLLTTAGVKKGERITTGSTLYRFAEPTLMASSIIPSASDPCATGTGYINVINAFTGGSLTSNYFVFNSSTSGVVGSIDLGIGMPSQAAVMTTSSGNGQTIATGSGSSDTGGKTMDNQKSYTGGSSKGRLSWREIRRN